MVLLVKGEKLYVHSKILGLYSDKIYRLMLRPDPMFGKQMQIRPFQNRARTKNGVIALLNAIYPPQMVPKPELFDEVYDIANEYEMELLVEKLKLGIIKNCELGPLEAAQKADKPPDVVYNAFAEFECDELMSLPGYGDLDAKTRLEVMRRRVELLEGKLETKAMNKNRSAHDGLFRECPKELALHREEDDGLGVMPQQGGQRASQSNGFGGTVVSRGGGRGSSRPASSGMSSGMASPVIGRSTSSRLTR